VVLMAALGPSRSHAAGNVVVQLSQGELDVTGDDAANTVVLTGGADSTTVSVTGLDGTLVNGATDATISGVQSLLVQMNDGPDLVEIRQMTLAGRAIVRLGSGDDQLLVEQARFDGRLRIFGNRGRDSVSLGPSVRVADQLRIETGRDRDFVALAASNFGGVVLVTGGGDDVVSFSDLVVGGPTTFFTDGGEDDVSAFNVRFEQDVDINLGPDDDVLSIVDVEFDDDAHLAGGDDDDLIEFGGFIDADDDFDIEGFEAGFF
jgi:hypothetical protein